MIQTKTEPILVCAIWILGMASVCGGESMDRIPFYVGTYTTGKSEGIYRLELNTQTGEISHAGPVTRSVNPSFLAIHPSGEYLFAVNETQEFRAEKTGAVSAFVVNPDSGSLTLINQRPSGGGAPCHLVVDATGNHVLVANYSGGSVASLPIGDNGGLGEATIVIQHHGSSVNPGRQKGPHAHSINLDSANRFAFAADLGLDQILVYRFDASTGELAPHDPAFANVHPGAGPRHFAFHPSGAYAYVINELDSTLTVFAYDSSSGTLVRKQNVSTLPSDFDGSSPHRRSPCPSVWPICIWIESGPRQHCRFLDQRC